MNALKKVSNIPTYIKDSTEHAKKNILKNKFIILNQHKTHINRIQQSLLILFFLKRMFSYWQNSSNHWTYFGPTYILIITMVIITYMITYTAGKQHRFSIYRTLLCHLSSYDERVNYESWIRSDALKICLRH
jgi:hypothetical protein